MFDKIIGCQASSSCSRPTETVPLQAGSPGLPVPALLPAPPLPPPPRLPPALPATALHANRLLVAAGDVALLARHLPTRTILLPACSSSLPSTLLPTSKLTSPLPRNQPLLTEPEHQRCSTTTLRRIEHVEYWCPSPWSTTPFLTRYQVATCQSQSLHEIQSENKSFTPRNGHYRAHCTSRTILTVIYILFLRYELEKRMRWVLGTHKRTVWPCLAFSFCPKDNGEWGDSKLEKPHVCLQVSSDNWQLPS